MNIAGRVVCFSTLPLLLVLAFEESFAGFERRSAGTRSFGTAGALCAFGEDAWSFYVNPAHAASISEAGLFYVPATLGLQEIKSTGISYRDNLLGVDFSAALQSFGYEIYRETVMSANVSVPLFDFLFLGSNINLNHVFIKDYGTDVAASLDVGCRIFLSERFSAGLSMTNLNSASMTQSDDRLPQSLAGGIAYISEALNLGIEYFKELGFPSAVRVAAEYSPVNFVTVRTGTASGSGSFNAGLSLRLATFTFEYGAMFHQVLGVTHSFGVSVRFARAGESEFESIQRYRESLRRR
jgi:hypothetical protein